MRVFKNTIIKDIKALRLDISIIFILSLFTIILIDFYLIDIPELFKGGYKLGLIIYRLCLSYISAFIFYFLVVHLKNQKDKRILYSYVSKFSTLIIEQDKKVSKDLAENSGMQLESAYPNSDELSKICKLINPNSDAPLIWGVKINDKNANWIQYFEHNRLKTFEYSSKLHSVINFLDSELVYKIARIEDCGHFVLIAFTVKFFLFVIVI